MKIKLDPDHFPILIILAFVMGMVLAIALGFRPDYGSHRREHSQAPPALEQRVLAWEGVWQ